MSTMTKEQLVEMFGAETAETMWEQMNPSTGGTQAPYTFITKISDMGSELGDWGTFVVGVEKEKDAEGNFSIKDKGTNLGNKFEILAVNGGFRAERWDAIKNRTMVSNSFTNAADINEPGKVVDLSTGKPIPANKEERKEAGWNTQRILGVLVRKDEKSAWIPAIFKLHGKMYFTFGDLLKQNSLRSEIMTGILQLHFVVEKKGATSYMVIDLKKSKVLPVGDAIKDNAPLIAEITKKMTEYRSAQKFTGEVDSSPSVTPSVAQESDNTDW